MFKLENITKIYGNEAALSNVSLTITGGMNFIIGASGSGKTTLLRICSAMDTHYDGNAFYQGKNLKTFTEKEKANFYSKELGFIAQGFHLIDELSVRENIMVPAYLKKDNSEKQLKSLLKKLGIEKIENQKVSTLSGGQKQRVAIARELMKNPTVLIADEPTAALDAKTAKEIAVLLYSIAKERTVVIVTHDTSLIQGKCSVFELDKGTLCKCEAVDSTYKQRPCPTQKNSLPFSAAITMANVSFKRHFGKMLSLILAVTVAASCLSVNFGGLLSTSSEDAFEELLMKQGNSVLNLNIVSSFMGAAGAGEELNETQSVTQNINGLMEQYQSDSRVEGITMISPINDAVVNMDGKDFIIEASGQAPVFNKIIAGKNADNSKHEVVLPLALVNKMGQTGESIVGKKLSFIGTVYNWESGEPVEMPVSFTATVSGVADTSYFIDIADTPTKFEHEDSLFLSLAVMKDIYSQAEINKPNFAFTIRPNSPENYMEIYNELMEKGIVPLGQVELIRDIVGLKGDTAAQTGISYALIAVLSVFAALSVCLVLSLMRKKEYAVYKLSGYTKASIVKLALAEYAEIFIFSGALCIITSLILSVPIWIGLALSLCVSAVCFALQSIIAVCTQPIAALKAGER